MKRDLDEREGKQVTVQTARTKTPREEESGETFRIGAEGHKEMVPGMLSGIQRKD